MEQFEEILVPGLDDEQEQLNVGEEEPRVYLQFPNRTAQVYRYDQNGRYLSTDTVWESPADWEINYSKKIDSFDEHPEPVWMMIPNVTLIAPPSKNHVWDSQEEEWTENSANYGVVLDSVKIDKRKQLTQVRDQIINQGFEFNGVLYDCDLTSRLNISGAVQGAILSKQLDQPYSESWTAKDNSQVEFDADDMIAMGMTCMKFVGTIHALCVQKKEEMMQLQTIDEVLNFTW